jgi:heat shock protein HtpX
VESDARVGIVILALLVLFSPVLLVVLVISPVFGRLIQLAVSRERQFLADAEAARTTRYPEALAKALEVLDKDTKAMPCANRATAPLFIVAPLLEDGTRIGGDGRSVWSSHPPVAERIERLRSIGKAEG